MKKVTKERVRESYSAIWGIEHKAFMKGSLFNNTDGREATEEI